MAKTDMDVQHAKVWELAKTVRIAMLVTKSNDKFAARPMSALIREDQGEGVVWFITDRESTKALQAKDDHDGLLSFSNGLRGDHVVLGGVQSVVDDRSKLKSLWSIGADTCFPHCPTDPAAILLRFQPATAEYWTGGSNIISFALGFAKAKLTGTPPNIGDHAKIAM